MPHGPTFYQATRGAGLFCKTTLHKPITIQLLVGFGENFNICTGDYVTYRKIVLLWGHCVYIFSNIGGD